MKLPQFLTISLIAINLLAVGQVKIAESVEIDLEKGASTSYKIKTFGKDGFVTYNDLPTPKAGIKTYSHTFYNNKLEVEKTVDIQQNVNFKLLHSLSTDNAVYQVFFKTNGTYNVVKFLSNGSKQEYNFKLLPKFRSSVGYILNNNLIMAGTVKSNATLFVVNLEDGTSKLINFLKYFKGSTQIKYLQYLKEEEEIHLWVSKLVAGKPEYHLMIIDNEGNVKGNPAAFTSIQGKIIDEISSKKLGNGDYLITGSYAEKSYGYAEGFFITKMSDNVIETPKYTLFTKLEKFFDYLPENQKNKIEKKQEKKNAKGEDLVVKYLLTLHDVVEVNGEYILLSEAYYPTYHTETYTTYVNGRPSTQTRRVFDGYEYTHATVLAFNKNLEIEWDNIFPMDIMYRPFTVKKFINMGIEKDEINLIYSTGNSIKTMTLVDGEETNKSNEKIKFDDDVISSRTIGNVVLWYDGAFLSYGVQTYKALNDDNKKEKKTLFYIQKITFK